MKYAIVESGGKQYKAVEGEPIEVDRLPIQAGENIKLERVLLLADGQKITVGTPLIPGFIVWAKAVEHFKGKKMIIFKYRPKKRIRVKTGHRQSYTRLMIEQIGGTTLAPKRQPAKKEEAEVEAEVRVKEIKPAPKEKKPAKAALVKPASKEKPVKTESAKKATKPAPKKAPAAAPKKTAGTASKKATKKPAKKSAA